MARCNPPKCYRTTKGKCMKPNPWILFRRWSKGRGLSIEQLREYYRIYVDIYEELKNQPDANGVERETIDYRRHLCEGLLHPRLDDNVQNDDIEALLTGHILENVLEYNQTLDCFLKYRDIEFFDRIFKSGDHLRALLRASSGGNNIRALNGDNNEAVCRGITQKLLKDVFEGPIVKRHRITRILAIGGSGFVAKCTFNRNSQRIIKVQNVIRDIDALRSYQSQHINLGVNPVLKDNYLDEITAHKDMMKLNDRPFNVPTLFGTREVHYGENPRTRSDMGVMVMEFVGGDTVWDMMSRETTSRDYLKTLFSQTIPQIFTFLHGKQIVHGDLHLRNIMIINQRVYIIDFGRTKKLSNRSLVVRLILRLYDYTLIVRDLAHKFRSKVVQYRQSIGERRQFMETYDPRTASEEQQQMRSRLSRAERMRGQQAGDRRNLYMLYIEAILPKLNDIRGELLDQQPLLARARTTMEPFTSLIRSITAQNVFYGDSDITEDLEKLDSILNTIETFWRRKRFQMSSTRRVTDTIPDYLCVGRYE